MQKKKCYVQVEILYKLQLVQNLNLYITYISLMKINNSRATHSYNIVIFIRGIFFFCINHSGSFPIEFSWNWSIGSKSNSGF